MRQIDSRHAILSARCRSARQCASRPAAAGLDAIPSNTLSSYDQVLDTAVLFDAVPDRFRGLSGADGSPATALERYFAMARGADAVALLEMTRARPVDEIPAR
ncbi:hypothetical protein I7331_11155 [Frankia sp. AgB1.8]|nr:hypothetical protein [Frankia sp. AgB1.8]